jgi:hypothetical protein
MGINYADYNIPLYGIFEDASKLAHHYELGIPADVQKQILTIYQTSTSNHLDTARALVDYCNRWRALIHRAESDPEVFSLLERHNQIRLENDLLYFKTCKSKPLDPKMQVFIPAIGWQDWVFHTFERYRWYLYRDLVKYVLRLSPETLAEKLHFYKEARARRAQRRVQRKLAVLNIT